MTYEVHILRSAEREMDRLPAAVHTRITRRILALEDTPRPRAARKLGGQQAYRLRVGEYRVLYTIDDRTKAVIVFAVGHRREIYR
ncbi:MAG: type II toxin-antitoxin system RelE/ParE family toxin [Chloroflexi bacterium]|nr:type II toxin-antitoxin system RelE/ParE family toxin [Chloroflexota bacterium]